MLLSVVYLRECRRQPIQDCVFGETKSRSATKNWSASGSGYGGGWKENKELDDITGFGWNVVVNNLSGSLGFELIVKRDCESILLKLEAWLLRLTLKSGRKVEISLESVEIFVKQFVAFSLSVRGFTFRTMKVSKASTWFCLR